MTMRRRAGGALITLAAAAMTVVMGATSAMAATTLTVRVTHGGTYTATTNKTVLSNRGVNVTCTSTSTVKASTGKGTIPTATRTGTSPVRVGSVSSLNFRHCTGPLGTVTTSVRKLPYSVKVDSTTTSTGKTDGMITGVNVHVSMLGCSFNVTGSAPGYYNNSDHTLHMTATLPKTPLNTARLTVGGVSGCAGLVQNGDHPKYTGTYKVSRAIVIRSRLG